MEDVQVLTLFFLSVGLKLKSCGTLMNVYSVGQEDLVWRQTGLTDSHLLRLSGSLNMSHAALP